MNSDLTTFRLKNWPEIEEFDGNLGNVSERDGHPSQVGDHTEVGSARYLLLRSHASGCRRLTNASTSDRVRHVMSSMQKARSIIEIKERPAPAERLSTASQLAKELDLHRPPRASVNNSRVGVGETVCECRLPAANRLPSWRPSDDSTSRARWGCGWSVPAPGRLEPISTAPIG